MDLGDVLDSVTIVHDYLRARATGEQSAYAGAARRWLLDIARIFEQEHVQYRVEPGGGVQFAIDEAFAQAHATAIAALEAPRYANSVAEFEKGMEALARVPVDGKAGIRGVFNATESVFHLIAPKAPRLGSDELKCLGPILQRLYEGDATALRASTKMLASFRDWVDAVHFYRHERSGEEVLQPPLQVAVYLISCGTAHCDGWPRLMPSYMLRRRPPANEKPRPDGDRAKRNT